MNIQILLYENMTALDAIGPYECLSRIPGVQLTMVGLDTGSVRTDTGSLGLMVDQILEDAPLADVVLVPGGPARGVVAMMGNERVKAWLQRQHAQTTVTASVCTGALILAAHGIVTSGPVASHWAAEERLKALGLAYSGQRLTENGKVVTAAGVSAGIDMALALIDRLVDRETAELIQLGIEYDPQPPFTMHKTPEKMEAYMILSNKLADSRKQAIAGHDRA